MYLFAGVFTLVASLLLVVVILAASTSRQDP
jgi:hypothetical protein